MMIAATRQFFDPLRLHCTLNIFGDFFIIASGVVYGNPVRTTSAILGSSSHVLGMFFSKKKIFNIPTSAIVMSIVIICGILYMLSGANLMRYEETPRYGELFGGLCISLAGLSVILGKSKLAMIFFTLSTTGMSASAFEMWFVRGEGDWLIFAASLMFYSAGFVAAFIKKEKSN